MSKAVTQFKPNQPQPKPTQVSKMQEPIERSTRGVRRVLFEEMEAVRTGRSTHTRANAIHKLGTGIIDAFRLEMQHEAHRAKYPLLEGETEESKVVKLDEGDA